jgi:hypothetical protein
MTSGLEYKKLNAEERKEILRQLEIRTDSIPSTIPSYKETGDTREHSVRGSVASVNLSMSYESVDAEMKNSAKFNE